MRGIWLTALFLALMLPLCCADDSWISSQYIILNTKIDSNMNVVGIGPDEYVESITANISFFPMETESQEIIEAYFEPKPKSTEGTVVFEWEKPTKKSIYFSIASKIRISNIQTRVNSKVDFPISNLSKELKEYTKPREIIDTNDDIKELASGLAEGEDDLYVVVNRIATWVNQNIYYNLTTVNVKATIEASEVLKTREGVCDEIASLFISLVRSIGIPARFVSGISYTNSPLFENEWGPHGWAEVYFPGHGWVPFDITYDEFGYVDPTHIISKISLDSGESTSQYVWRGRDVKLNTKELNIDVSMDSAGPKAPSQIMIESRTLKEDIGFGSFNLVEGTITNLGDYYQSVTVRISQTTDMNVLGEEKKHIVLKPKQSKRVYWIIDVDSNLKRNYIYTFPISVYSTRGEMSNTSFSSSEDSPAYSISEINNTLSALEEEEVKTYSRKINLECSAAGEYYIYEDPQIDCWMKNLGNVFLKDLSVCMNDECRNTDLGISQEETANFTIYFPRKGQNDITITARNPDVSKTANVRFNVLDEPRIDIVELKSPESVSYSEQYNVSFLLYKNSTSNPLEMKAVFGQNGLRERIDLDEMNQSQRYIFQLRGKDLSVGNNSFYIIARYKDKNNREYRTESEFRVELERVNWWQRILIFMKDMEKKVRGLFD